MKKIFALGFFDGVHLGHQALLKECCRLAEQQEAKACAITFAQHPQSLFVQEPPRLINDKESRIRLLRQYGIGPVFIYPVTQAVMAMPWQDFLDELVSCDSVGFVCGRDFRFGSRGEGNAENLMSYCRERELICSIVEDQLLEGVRISSTHIRGLIEEGQMDDAVKFLGHPHILQGEVMQGRHLGRTIGVPTANILIPEGVVVPKLGVYACKCAVEGAEYLAVTNVGFRPTVGGHQTRAESWLLDFEGDLYGREVTLQFYRFLRPEQKFASLEELKAQIQKDAAETVQLLK